MLIYNLGHGEYQNTPKQNQLLQKKETNKIQINWKLIEGKTRFQTRKQKRERNRDFPPVKTDRSPLKNL